MIATWVISDSIEEALSWVVEVLRTLKFLGLRTMVEGSSVFSSSVGVFFLVGFFLVRCNKN